MKILAVSVLLVALMALALATEEIRIPGLEEAIIEDAIETAIDIEELESIEGKRKCAVKKPVCAPGWAMTKRTCYRYFAKAVTWAEAQASCRSLGANLASMHNKDEKNRLWTLAQKKTAWIGLSDAQQDNYWFWIDGTALDYKNWCKGQPQLKNNEHCAVMWKDQNCWHDYNCSSHRFPYVCARAAR